MRASRLLSILLLLQTRGRMTAEQLSSALEVSVRTIYRDVDALSASGVPVYADRGAHGGFQLVEGYRTRLTGLTPEEAEALFLSGYPGPAAELGLGTVLAAAQLKVLAALPPELRGRAARLRQRFHLDAPGWFQEAEAAPHLQPIAEAVWSDRRLWMRYRRGDAGQEVERTIDPLGVVLKGGIWYLVARIDGNARTYRVSRILDLKLLDERFERPDDFELGEFWQQSVASFTESFPSFPVKVRMGREAVERLWVIVGAAQAREALATGGDPEADGRRTYTVQMEGPWRAEVILLALGADAQVVEPAELRDRVAHSAAELLAAYGGGSPAGAARPVSEESALRSDGATPVVR